MFFYFKQKEISWQNARIEASANDDATDNNNTAAAAAAAAIRLIANACRIRIAMKKNLQGKNFSFDYSVRKLDLCINR